MLARFMSRDVSIGTFSKWPDALKSATAQNQFNCMASTTVLQKSLVHDTVIHKLVSTSYKNNSPNTGFVKKHTDNTNACNFYAGF